VGDHIFVSKVREPMRGDAVVFVGSDGHHYVKRLIAVGPSEVFIQGGIVFVNGVPLPQRKAAEPCPLVEPCHVVRELNAGFEYSVLYLEPSYTRHEVSKTLVGQGEVFLLGDNRDVSHDSRQMGPIALTDITGVVTMVWWSPDQG
jgi:signal peptidase I